MRYFLGVDGGQSSTRAAIGTASGRVVSRAVGAPCRRATSGEGAAQFRAGILELLANALSSAGLPPGTSFDAACFGMSGGAEDKRRILVEIVPSAAIEVTDDAEAALEGAIADGPGLIVIAGTGSMALARDCGGSMARSGGWGYLFGDEGGAFDIVRSALRAALGSEEGWGKPTSLAGMFLESTGASSVNDALHRFYDADWPPSRVAGLAPLVDQAARAGDRAANEVLAAAGTSLGAIALRAVEALGTSQSELTAFMAGGVFRCERVRATFSASMQEAGLSVGRPAHDATVGALRLAYRLRDLDVALEECR